MKKRALLLSLLVALVSIGCDDPWDRNKKLEAENKQLRDKQAAQEYELKGKCGNDAKVWFNSNWSRDSDTILLNYTNHYNKTMNKCFAEVEYHFNYGKTGSWSNSISVWDVQENSKVADFGELHEIYFGTSVAPSRTVDACLVYGTKCNTLDEFNRLVAHYMND